MLATMVGDLSGAAAAARAEAPMRVATRAILLRRASRRRLALAFGLAVLIEGGIAFALLLAGGSLGKSAALLDKPIWIDISMATDSAPAQLGGAGIAVSHNSPQSPRRQLPSKAKLALPPAQPPLPAQPQVSPTDSEATDSKPKPIAESVPVVAHNADSIRPPALAAPPPALGSPATPASSDPAASSAGDSPAPPPGMVARPSDSYPGGIAGGGSAGSGKALGVVGAIGVRERIAAELAAYVEAHKSYPEAARMRGAEGTVRLSATMDRLGNLLSIAIISGSGSRILDSAAETALRSAFPLANAGTGTLTVELAIRYSLKD